MLLFLQFCGSVTQAGFRWAVLPLDFPGVTLMAAAIPDLSPKWMTQGSRTHVWQLAGALGWSVQAKSQKLHIAVFATSVESC